MIVQCTNKKNIVSWKFHGREGNQSNYSWQSWWIFSPKVHMRAGKIANTTCLGTHIFNANWAPIFSWRHTGPKKLLNANISQKFLTKQSKTKLENGRNQINLIPKTVQFGSLFNFFAQCDLRSHHEFCYESWGKECKLEARLKQTFIRRVVKHLEKYPVWCNHWQGRKPFYVLQLLPICKIKRKCFLKVRPADYESLNVQDLRSDEGRYKNGIFSMLHWLEQGVENTNQHLQLWILSGLS